MGDLTFELLDGSGQAIRARLPDNQALAPRTWQHICVRYSGGQSQSSATILVNGRHVSLRHGDGALVEATPLASAPLKVASMVPTAGLSDIRIYRRWINDQEVQLLAEDFRLLRLLRSLSAWDDLSAEDRQRFSRHYDEVMDQNYRQGAAKLAETERRRDFIYSPVRTQPW